MSIKNKNIKLISVLLLFCVLISHAYAQGGGGILMGIQVGQSNLNNLPMTVATGSNGNDAQFPVDIDSPQCNGLNGPNCQNFISTSPSNTGFAFRLYGGAGFNKYIAAETGLAYYTPSQYKPNVPYTTHEPQIREYAFDVLGRFTLPIKDFGIFAKGGLAVIYKSESGALEVGDEATTGGNVYVRPEIGVGLSYSFEYFTVDVSSNRILQGSDIQQINFTALGFTYQFTDKYCGQFLC